MNTESLFKRFDELSDSPVRIPALRKVIVAYLLHSAVNSPDATSRAGTLREAHEIRRRELKKKASRKEFPIVPEVADEDLPPSLSDIPAALFDRLGNIASIEKGLSQIQSTKPGKYPLVVTAETRSSSESFDFEGAAAIIPLVSSTGHGDASLKRLHYQEGLYAVGNILAVVKPICPDLLRARFIYEYLSAFKEELLVSRMVGTANVSLTVNKLKEVPVPLVSGPVLSRIDELMALCDRLEAQQQERETRHAALARASLARFADAPTPENLNFLFHPSYTISPADLRKSILTLAIQGKLVPQDPNDEPAEELLSRLERERAHIAKAQGVRPPKNVPPLTINGYPHDIPETWQWSRIGHLALTIDYGTSQKASNDSTKVPVYRMGNIVGGRLVDKNLKYVDASINDLPGLYLKTHDILFNRTNSYELVGKAGIYTGPDDTATFASYLIRIRLPETLLFPPFFSVVMNAPYYRQTQIEPEIVQQCGQANFNGTKLASTVVPVPPLAEQLRIVAKVEQLMVLVDALETQLAASRATAANLLSVLVAELTGTPEGRVTTTSPVKPIAASARPKPQKTTVATAKPVAQESTVSPRTLADLRKAAGLTQAAVAEVMGLNQAYISQMETGKRPITKEQHSNFLKIFGMIADEVPR